MDGTPGRPTPEAEALPAGAADAPRIPWQELGPDIRDRFDGSVGHLHFRSEDVRTDGTARGCYVIRFMRLLGTAFPAPGQDRASDIDVDVIAPGRRSWRRSYVGGLWSLRLDTVKTEKGGLIEERSGVLAIVLEPELREDRIVLRSRRFDLALGPVRIPLPAFAVPGRLVVEHRHLEAGAFVFDMRLIDRRAREIFVHRGRYRDVRRERPAGD